jgi:hypothetical protein
MNRPVNPEGGPLIPVAHKPLHKRKASARIFIYSVYMPSSCPARHKKRSFTAGDRESREKKEAVVYIDGQYKIGSPSYSTTIPVVHLARAISLRIGFDIYHQAAAPWLYYQLLIFHRPELI